MGLTKAMRSLVIDYVAHIERVASLEEVNWSHLATRLSVPDEFIGGAIESLKEEEREAIFFEAIEKRVKHAQGSRIFTDANWEQLEGRVVDKLLQLVEKGLIRDPGELLAISKVANQMNAGFSQKQEASPAQTVTANFTFNGFGGQGEMAQESDGDSPTIPARTEQMRIDLSPRIAASLQENRERNKERMIDAERVGAEELRSLNMRDSASIEDAQLVQDRDAGDE